MKEEEELGRRLRYRLRLTGDLNSISGKEEEVESEEAEVEDSAFFSASETFAKQSKRDLLRSDKAMFDNV